MNLTINFLKALTIVLGIVSDNLREKLEQTAYLKTPAWVNFATKYKASTEAAEDNHKNYGFYYDGSLHKDSVFGDFNFLVSFLGAGELVNSKPIHQLREDWDTHAPAYLKALESPSYPYPIDQSKAERGFQVFSNTCTKCHGEYSIETWNNNSIKSKLVTFNQKLIDIDRVKTDSARALFTSVIEKQVNRKLPLYKSEEKSMKESLAYVVQPLHGIWARAPYLHNGSVPNIRSLLNPELRECVYYLPLNSIDPTHYDEVELGWKVSAGSLLREEYTKKYDCNEALGLGIEGHPFGTQLSDADKDDLIEFLKTL